MATQDVATASRSTSTFFATLSIAGFVYGALALLLLHVLRPDYTVVDHMISDYGVGRFGWIMSSCFLAMGFGCLMLMLGLARTGPTSVTGRMGTFMLVLPSIGLAVSAFFPTDLETATVRTSAGQVHDIGFLVNILSILIAASLLSAGFGSHPRWRSFQRTSVVLTLLIVFALILQFLTLHRGAPYGIVNRIFVVVLGAWFVATAVRMRGLERE